MTLRLLALLFCLIFVGCEATKLPSPPPAKGEGVAAVSPPPSAKKPPSEKEKAPEPSVRTKTPPQMVSNPAIAEATGSEGLFPPNGQSPTSQPPLVVAKEEAPPLPQEEPSLNEGESREVAVEPLPEKEGDVVLKAASLRPRGVMLSHFWQELYDSVSLQFQAKLLSIQAAVIAAKEKEEKARIAASPKPILVLEKGDDDEAVVKVSGAEGYTSAKFTRVGAPSDPYRVDENGIRKGVGSTPVDGLQSESVFKSLETGDTLYIPVFRPGYREPLSVDILLSRDGKSFERTTFSEEEVAKVLEESPLVVNVSETKTPDNPLAGEAPRGEDGVTTESFETNQSEEESDFSDDTVFPDDPDETSQSDNGTDSSLAGEAPRDDSNQNSGQESGKNNPLAGEAPRGESAAQKWFSRAKWILAITVLCLGVFLFWYRFRPRRIKKRRNHGRLLWKL